MQKEVLGVSYGLLDFNLRAGDLEFRRFRD